MKDCTHEKECAVCSRGKDPNTTCIACQHFHMISPMKGICKFPTAFIILPWCRDICGQVRVEEKKV